jgi:hypothetical protein
MKKNSIIYYIKCYLSKFSNLFSLIAEKKCYSSMQSSTNRALVRYIPTFKAGIPTFKAGIPTFKAGIPTLSMIIPTTRAYIPTLLRIIPTFSHFRHF